MSSAIHPRRTVTQIWRYQPPRITCCRTSYTEVAIVMRKRRGSLAMEDLFPDFEWQSVEKIRRLASLKGGMKLGGLKLNE